MVYICGINSIFSHQITYLTIFFIRIISEKCANAREKLVQLKDSWSKSLKRISGEASAAIDRHGLADESKAAEKEVPAKKSVAARNNWGMSNGLVDSDSDTELEVVPDSEEESDDENEASSNELIQNEAEEVEDYDTGDSMDEDERREIEGLFYLI